MNGRLKMLKDALTVLASTAEEQLQYLKDQGVPECIDELALDYDAIAAAADRMVGDGELDNQQCLRVKQLSEFLAQFGGQSYAGL